MINSEFSDQFDVLLNSYNDIKEFGKTTSISSIQLNEFEKSVLLTKAQNTIVIELYTGKNASGDAYETKEEIRRYLANLNTTKIINEFTSYPLGLSPTSVKCDINENILYITQEQCKINSNDICLNDTWVDTYPIKRDIYNRTKNNPFKNDKIWRVDLGINSVELISKNTITEYKVSFLKKPTPIILEDIGNLSIEGISEESETNLHPILHNLILERAVIEAYNYMAAKTNNN